MENMDKRLSVPKWMDKSAENTPNTFQNFRPNLSAQAQKFGIFEKKTLSRCP